MIFNNQLQINNILGSCYLSGNLIYYGDELYTPLNNTVKKIDCTNNITNILPFELSHQTKIIKIHPSGIIMIAIDMSGKAIVFNLKGYFIIAQFNFKQVVICATFSPNGQLFAIAQSHGFTVYQSPSPWRTFQPFLLLKKYKNRHTAKLTSLSFTYDNKFIITCGQDYLIYINNLSPITNYIPITLDVHKNRIIAVYPTQNMQYIYSIDSGSNIYIWKWVEDYLSESYLNLKQSKHRKLAHLQNRNYKNILKQQNKQHFQQQQQQQNNLNKNLSIFEKKINKGRYILSKKLIVTQTGGYLKRVYFQVENGFLCNVYSHGKFCIYKLIKQELNGIQSYSIGNNQISTLAVNPTCTWIAFGIKTLGQIIIWQWKSQSYILNQKGFIYETQAMTFYGGKVVATGTTDGKVKIWDKQSGFCIATIEEHQSTVTDLKFSNKNTLFSSSLDGSVNGYDITKYKMFRKFKTDNKSQIKCLQVDESGDIIFGGCFDPYEIFAWNIQTSNILQIIRGHQSPISCIAMIGQHLVSGSWDRSLKIHEIFARKLNVQSLDHTSEITAIAVNPNNQQISVATMKGEIYIWDVENAQLLGIINAQLEGGRSYTSKISYNNDKNNRYLRCLCYSPCGQYLLGGGKSKYLTVYDIKNKSLFKKITLTKNKDLQGVMEKLNSKFIKDGVQTYKLSLLQQEQNMSDNQQVKLPGSKKIDVSEVRLTLEVEIRQIAMKSNNEVIVNTSFGVLILTNAINCKHTFNPYEMHPHLTPMLVTELLIKQQYAPAIIAALKLNISSQKFSLRKVLLKIPIQSIKHTISEIDSNKLSVFLEKISEQSHLSFLEIMWVEIILQQPIHRVPISLLTALEPMVEQVSLSSRIKGILDMANKVSL